MCNRGQWRGLDTVTLNGMLSAIEQCTECGEYRAKNIEDAQYVDPTSDEGAQESANDQGW